MGKGFPFLDQVLELRKTMDIPKVFGTRDLWDGHRCRQLTWAVFDIKFWWENRQRPNRNFSTVQCVGVTIVWFQEIIYTGGTVQGAEEIDKASNKCLPDVVVTALEKVQAPGKGVNDVGLKE